MSLALAAAATPVGARSYCCTDEGGRRVCGDVLPQQCMRRAYQEINAQGTVAKEFEAPMSAEQRALREAELARKREADRAADEERRRNQALRASYASVKDIDAKRDRMLAEAEASLKEAQERYDDALARKKHLEGELEFYQKKPAPASLLAQFRENRDELEAHEAGLEARKREIEAIRLRFEDEKKRYLALTGRK
jgi:hypothetical protein